MVLDYLERCTEQGGCGVGGGGSIIDRWGLTTAVANLLGIESRRMRNAVGIWNGVLTRGGDG